MKKWIMTYDGAFSGATKRMEINFDATDYVARIIADTFALCYDNVTLVNAR